MKKFISLITLTVLVFSLIPNVYASDNVTIATTDKKEATVGNTLSAVADNPVGEVSYCWYADNEVISGEVGQEFVLTYAHLGKKIKCKITDDNGSKESNEITVTSAFDNYLDSTWSSTAMVKLGEKKTGFGDKTWDFSMKNSYGTNLSFSILDVQNNKSGKYYVLANDYYSLQSNKTSDSANVTDTVYNPNAENTVAYDANTAFSQKSGKEYELPNAIVDAIDKKHIWITEKDKKGSIENVYTFAAGITVPAVWELQEYIDRIKIDVRKSNEILQKNAMWLRTAYNAKTYLGINPDTNGDGNFDEDIVIQSETNNNYYFKLTAMSNTTGIGYIRPQFFLNDDFFKHAKVDLKTAGSNVIAEIEKVPYENLSELYSDSDIETYLPNVTGYTKKISAVIATTDEKDATVGNTLFAKVENAQGEVSYQWYADGVKIDGETSETLILTYDYFEKTISCKVSDGVNERESNNSLKVTSDFDKHKDQTWLNQVAVTLGTEPTGFGNEDWEFQMENQSGNTLSFSLLKVDNNKKSKFYVIANDYYGVTVNDTVGNKEIVDSRYNPEMEGTVAYTLNTNFMQVEGKKNELPEQIVNAIDKDHIWITEKDSENTIKAPFTVKAGITVPAIWELQEYIDRIKIDIRKSNEIAEKIPPWLRTALKYNHYHAVSVDPNDDNNVYDNLVTQSKVNGNYYFKLQALHITNTTSRGYIRPQFFLNEDFFLDAKIDLTRAGKGIIKTLSEEYSRDELLKIYTEEELESAGMGTNYGINVIWKSGDKQISSLDGVTSLSAQITLNNKISQDKKCVVILALYDGNGTVVKMTGKDVVMKKNSITELDLMTLSDLSDISQDYHAEVYVWDSLFDMNAITASEKL